MPSRLICLICGASEMEVPRMHCFPTNLEKSKVWQENMGMVFSGDCRRGQRICSRHFASDCYVGVKLRRGSEPTLYPVHRRESSIPESIEITPKIHSISTPPDIIEVDQFQEIPSTSHARTETPQLQTGKFYKGIANLSRLKASPRKQKLIELIRKNEDYIRKLKRKIGI
ncbi:hypothetical protein ABEB36_014219 [Hypothenemus hampei]|uniref:THAP-type domain-containing protein n=1 Tax=Hypothenemus hampei TaxID=57062 RepID=A0ABD1E895_HYPHA